MRGKVKWFNDQKGYGFISAEERRGEVFFHASAVLGEGATHLSEGDLVTFELIDSERGPKASNVVKTR